MDNDQFVRQFEEFEALTNLHKIYEEMVSISSTSVDYINRRSNYEQKLWSFFEACKANGRFE